MMLMGDINLYLQDLKNYEKEWGTACQTEHVCLSKTGYIFVRHITIFLSDT